MCIGRNAKARPGAAAEERTLGDSGMEVVVRGWGSTLAVVRILRKPRTESPGPDTLATFSEVDMLVGNSVPGDRAAFARSLMAGC